MLFLVTKKENIKCTNCPISTHPTKKVTCACHACLCFSYCLYIHSSSLFRFHAKFFLFLSRAVSENATLPNQEHLILLAKQSGQHGMILVIFQRLITVPAFHSSIYETIAIHRKNWWETALCCFKTIFSQPDFPYFVHAP